MIREQVIVHKLQITRLQQRISFQIRLPKDAHRIIGLEYNVRKIYGNPYVSRLNLPFGWEGDTYFKRNKNKLIGRLSLANNCCEGLFYQGDLIEDRNEIQYEGIASWVYTPKVWMMGSRREEIGFNVHGGMIHGLYEDSLGVNEYTELAYDLSLYLWIEKCII